MFVHPVYTKNAAPNHYKFGLKLLLVHYQITAVFSYKEKQKCNG